MENYKLKQPRSKLAGFYSYLIIQQAFFLNTFFRQGIMLIVGVITMNKIDSGIPK